MPKMYAAGLAEAETRGPGKKSPGLYSLRVTAAEQITARTGKPGFKLTFITKDGPEDANGNNPAGWIFEQRFFLGEPTDKDGGKALTDRTANTCAGCGVAFDDEGFELDDFLDADCDAHMRQQKSNPEYLEISYFEVAE